MMENNNDWFENLNYPSIDHQQQTYVTKHDLELLHKKIIATDLIVQKYQEANKALLRLQVENDDLKQQIEQITNECCIFSKQVTECTQECDNLKEQIEISNSEKRELHQQVRLLQDENTNNYHEIMVLRQFESLKETNDQLTKTVERQQKTIGKLQLQLQRKSPVIYKPNKNKQEPSETDIALTKSEKSVRELKLALGRLVNFIQSSKIEIPTALHIRPVLKAHEINDDFLEIEGDFIRKPVKKVSKPVVSQTDDDDDDDGDFIDVNHSIPVPPVNTIDIIEQTPKSSRQQKKKTKSTKKSRRKKDISISENPSTKLDDLVNELEIALSQTNQPQSISQLSSFLSDDDDNEDKTHKSDKQQSPILPYTPIILQSKQTNSSITITKHVSFSSDDEISQRKLSPVIERTISSLQVDSITPMEIETLNKPTNYMSFLSEDDDDNNNKSIPSEYISPLSFYNDNHSSQSSDKPLSTTDDVPQQSLSSIHINILDSNRIKIVLRLLNVLTDVPVFLKPLRLVRRRIQQQKIPEEQVILPTERKSDDTTISQIEENKTILENQVSIPMEEIDNISEDQLKSNEENQVSIQMEETDGISEDQLKSNEENHNVSENEMIIDKKLQTSVGESLHEEQPPIIKESSPISIPQKSTPTIEAIQSSDRPLLPLVLEIPKQSVLKPFQISILSRLLNTLTNLPVKPLIHPIPFSLRKRKRKSVVKTSSIPLLRQTSNRMQTRSLNSIRARIARCNQPTTTTKKRTTISSPPPPSSISKRIKSTTNEYDLINKFLNSFSKEINDELKNILDKKLHEDISLFIDNICRIISELMIDKCDIILLLVKRLHPYEESIKILLEYIYSKSLIFQQNFIQKLNQTFEYEIKQQTISDKRIQILNRLFILTCSIFPTSSSVFIYTRLFDIGYYLSHDILRNTFSFLTSICPSLISNESQTNSSSVLLHKILIEILIPNKFDISFEYLENLLITYQNNNHDKNDLIRCLILIFRHRKWFDANEFCSKILFTLINKINDQYQRLTILIILQFILFIYKDNEDFKQDIIFHDQIKQQLLSIKTMNRDECTVRDKIFSILDTYCLINK